MSKVIIVPIDGSSSSKRALEFALSMAKAYGDEIRLVNVQQHHTILGEPIIQEAATMIEKENVPYTSTIRTGTLPSIEIVSEGKEENVRCIVIGSKWAGNSANRFGSVSEEVLKMATCPVVILPS